MVITKLPSLGASRRSLQARAHTLFSPTPTSLQSYLTAHQPSSSSTSLYLLSTSLHQLPSLLSTLQTRLPSSVGSFSSPIPGSPPSLSIVTFESGVQVFRSGLSGRPPPEVGRSQRPSLQGYAEDRKGSVEGDVEAIRGGQGWAGLWKSQMGNERIQELEGVKCVFCSV